jgi:putative DNA primase/helicase
VRVVETKEARQHLAKFLRYRPRARIIRAPRTGWFKIKKNCVFVLPEDTLGDAGSVSVILDAPANATANLHRSGTSDQWCRCVAKPHAKNSNVLLAVGSSFAAPLLRFADEPGGGFHFHGTSKLGKTLVGVIGQSVWGKPYAPGAGADAFGFTWETTPARIGERAVLRSDLPLYLDEIGVGEPKAVANAAYKLAGGLDKGRYGQVERDFNVLFVSTGEPSPAEFLPGAKAGQLVRLVDIPADVGSGSAFETFNPDEAGKKFYAATKEYHGSVGHDWLQHLVALGPTQITKELKRQRAEWRELPAVADIARKAHPRVVSVVNRFALIAAALRMASAAEIVPWSVADIDAGVIACMTRWVQQRRNTDAAGELLREIWRRRRTITATIDDHFIRLRLDENGRLGPASPAVRRLRQERTPRGQAQGMAASVGWRRS